MTDRYRNENGVFHNKLGISDAATLHDVEYTVSSSVAKNILSGKIPLEEPAYSLVRLQEIHQNLFGDIYEWAGKIRTFESSKGNRLSKTVTKFEQPENIVQGWEEVAQMAERFATAKDLDFQTAKEQLTDILIKANYIHPFPEGNGRALQVFMTLLAREQNITMNYGKADPEMWNQANALSVPHFRRFEGHLVPQEANRFSLNLLLKDVIRANEDISHNPKQENEFAKLEKAYNDSRHLFSPFQKQVADKAGAIIRNLPAQMQQYAKANLYRSQLDQIQPEQSKDPDIEIDR